jgi:hypothetical protein
MSKCRLVVAAPIVIVALAIALLSHAMTGLLGLLGLAAVSLSADSSRGRVLLAAGAVVTIVLAICCLWPYYPFVQAVLRNPNPGYWYNPYILKSMLTNWCLPAMLASLLAMPYRREPLVRFAMWGLFATLMLTALAAASRSPTFARLPLAGLIFAQVLTGAVLHHWELSRASSWRDILSRLRSLSPDAFIPGFVRALLPALLLYFGVPQLVDAIRQPHLLRPILAKWLQVDDRRAHWFQQYQAVLAPVGERDVVMAESSTGWPVPSFRGRIVAAEHFELFTPDQQRRFDDVQVFMAPGTRQATRVQLIQRYGVSWILLDRRANASVLPELLVANAIAREAGRLILIDAARWCEAVAVPTVPK